ncbi:hypothetical protein [Cytobacillus sp.]|uniref:hypothetical protein n=1 Tax=Cytobacillus sp. TaxID=2675269 RepID=UPI0028BE0792|nr:hypothetical protein [Cytobacillus sp.]
MFKKYRDLEEAIESAVEVLEEVEVFRSDIQVEVENLVAYVERFDDEDEKEELLEALDAIKDDLNSILTRLT